MDKGAMGFTAVLRTILTDFKNYFSNRGSLNFIFPWAEMSLITVVLQIVQSL